MLLKMKSSYWLPALAALFMIVFFACESDDSDGIDRTSPTVPDGLRTSNADDSSIRIIWEASGDNIAVTGYVVYQNDIQVANDSLVGYVAENLTPETEYTYSVRAFDAAGNISGFTPEIRTSTLGQLTENDTIAPTIPQNLEAIAITETSASLSWEAATDNLSVIAYQVFQDDVLLANVLNTEFEVTQLSSDTEYSFVVYAIDKSDNRSASSEVLTLTTEAAEISSPNDTVSPTRPTNVTVSDSTATQITLNWTAAVDSVGVTGYRIFQDDVAIDTTQETTYIVTELTPGTRYTFTVSAFDAAENESAVSDPISAFTLEAEDTTAPDTPTGLASSNISQTSIDLNWNPATDDIGVSSYRIFQNELPIATVQETAYQVTGLTPGTTYAFSISAVDTAENESPSSVSVSVSTLDPNLGTIDKILVFTKTSEFRHTSIAKGVETLAALGQANNFEVVQTENGGDFNVNNLQQYQAVVFLSTTGDVLNDTQQTAFENYIRSGGSFMGIHAATDTEYDWPWYGQLVGAYFDGHPNIQPATINVVDSSHASTSQLPNPWNRTDEWYNFRDINPNINVLLNLDESSYDGGTNGDNHPHAWYHTFDGGKSFYTAGGHSDANFDEPDFQLHLLGGILYCLDR